VRRWWLYIRQQRRCVSPLAWFIKSRFEISGLLKESGGNPRVFGCLGKLEKYRHLARKILSPDHWAFPANSYIPPLLPRAGQGLVP
jgi:hypothetical protein